MCTSASPKWDVPCDRSLVVGRGACRTTVILMAMAVMVAAAGCGAGETPTRPQAPTVDLLGLSADDVLAAARAAANDARSVHVVGGVSQGGRRTTLDLRLSSGGEGSGFVATTGGRVDIARVGRDVYFRADEVTLTQVLGPDRASAAGGRFVKVPAGDATFRSFRDLLDKRQLVEMLLFPAGALSRVDGIPVDGVPTVGLHDDDPDAPGVLYVAASGTPYPLLLKPDDVADGVGELRLSEWNADVQIAPPPAAEVVAVEDLE